jgi:hypothetical protein
LKNSPCETETAKSAAVRRSQSAGWRTGGADQLQRERDESTLGDTIGRHCLQIEGFHDEDPLVDEEVDVDRERERFGVRGKPLVHNRVRPGGADAARRKPLRSPQVRSPSPRQRMHRIADNRRPNADSGRECSVMPGGYQDTAGRQVAGVLDSRTEGNQGRSQPPPDDHDEGYASFRHCDLSRQASLNGFSLKLLVTHHPEFADAIGMGKHGVPPVFLWPVCQPRSGTLPECAHGR